MSPLLPNRRRQNGKIFNLTNVRDGNPPRTQIRDVKATRVAETKWIATDCFEGFPDIIDAEGAGLEIFVLFSLFWGGGEGRVDIVAEFSTGAGWGFVDVNAADGTVDVDFSV